MAKQYIGEECKGAPWNIVELDAKQKREWEMTRAALLWNCPAFTHILYSMMNPSGDSLVAQFTMDIPTMATDGVALVINPVFFFALPLDKRIFGIAHEIMHNVFDHVGLTYAHQKAGKIVTSSGKSLPFDAELLNMAEDLVINDMLIQSRVGQIDAGWLHDSTVATMNDSVVDVYAKLFQEEEKGKGSGPSKGNGANSGKDRKGQSQQDSHLPPGASQGKAPAQAQADRNTSEWNTAVAAAAASAKAQGKLPAAMEKLFGLAVEPVVSWQDKVRGFLSRKAGGGGYDWKKPDRRMVVRNIIAPARSGHGMGLVVIGFDTSGSIYASKMLLERFLGEVGGILSDLKPAETRVVWCDAKVHRVDEVDDLTDLQGLRPVGGGGTEFEPVFDYIDQEGLRPDALIYLTDGYGSFPEQEPDYPVLWGNVGRSSYYPFGEVVEIPHDGAF